MGRIGGCYTFLNYFISTYRPFFIAIISFISAIIIIINLIVITEILSILLPLLLTLSLLYYYHIFYRTISFIDLAGSSKYLKTSLHGIVGHNPNYFILVISAKNGIEQMTIEFLGIGCNYFLLVFLVSFFVINFIVVRDILLFLLLFLNRYYCYYSFYCCYY